MDALQSLSILLMIADNSVDSVWSRAAAPRDEIATSMGGERRRFRELLCRSDNGSRTRVLGLFTAFLPDWQTTGVIDHLGALKCPPALTLGKNPGMYGERDRLSFGRRPDRRGP